MCWGFKIHTTNIWRHISATQLTLGRRGGIGSWSDSVLMLWSTATCNQPVVTWSILNDILLTILFEHPSTRYSKSTKCPIPPIIQVPIIIVCKWKRIILFFHLGKKRENKLLFLITRGGWSKNINVFGQILIKHVTDWSSQRLEQNEKYVPLNFCYEYTK